MNSKSRQVKAHIVNAFTVNKTRGNPAGVVLDADHFSDEEMLHIARKIGLSETVFVSQSESETLKLDFFTPNRRIAHCGHATIAVFSYLAKIGVLGEGEASKETVDGPRKIVIREGAAYMEQLAPQYTSSDALCALDVSTQAILDSLNLEADALDPHAPIACVNTGNRFLIVPVRDGHVLANISPDMEKIAKISEKLDLIGFYVFTSDANATLHHATTRMFAPRFAIDEESATGMAAGPLACYLREYRQVNDKTIYIEQGSYMQPKSTSLITIELEIAEDKILRLMAGGYGEMDKEISINLE